MKAAVHTRYGPPEVVRVSDVEKPTAKDNEVLVKVHATTVNRTDCGFRAAKPFIVRFFSGLFRPRVTVLGNEFAGEVEAVGSGVTSFEVGDRVFGYSEGPFGAHAEYMAIPEDGLLAIMPANLSYEEAAPSTEGSHYALSFITTAKIQSGHDVLVNGATGAIGSAAVQLLKSVGADVTATCDAQNVERVRGLGADRVIDYTAEDFTSRGRRYDVIMDNQGNATYPRVKGSLAPGGRVLMVNGDLWPTIAASWQKAVVRGTATISANHLQTLLALTEGGALRPVIDSVWPFDKIVHAHRRVDGGHKAGSVVVTFDHAVAT